MSLYALFPPLETPTPSTGNGGSSSSFSMQTTRCVDGPLHETGGSFSTLLRASVDRFVPNSLISSQGGGNVKKEEHETRDNIKNKESANRMGISVKEAKIDPVRLVQCVAGNNSSSRQTGKKCLRRRNSPHDWDSSQQMKSAPSTSSKPGSRKTMASKSKSNRPTNPHEDAIEFELSISFNGRKYVATRTLQCIIQLRNDLVREMSNRRKWLQQEQSSSSSSSISLPSLDSTECFWEMDDSEDFVEIPEIPPIDEGGGPGGFVVRGFTMLHAVLSSYCPTLERWLGSVMAIVPQDSECLTNFLWEPLSKEAEIDLGNSCVSLATLGSIKELAGDECSTDDDDSDDEWEG